jgi:hypothetical protein
MVCIFHLAQVGQNDLFGGIEARKELYAKPGERSVSPSKYRSYLGDTG